MRIVHLLWSLGCGGSETMLVDIANEQSRTANVVVVIGNDRVDPTVLARFSPAVTLKLLARPEGSRNPWYLLKLYMLLRYLAPDIVHAHQESVVRILRRLPFPKVQTVHNTGIALSPASSYFDATYVISRSVQEDLKLRYPAMKTVLVPNGVPCASISVKSSYGGTPFRIVQVGRLDHIQKGQDILLRAIARVTRLIGKEAVTVDFIGAGPSREYLLRIADELGVGAVCRFLGQKSREEIYRELESYDLLVQPSRFEGFGLTVVEAMAAQVPVLVSDVQGPMEIIGQGQYGFHFCSEDFDDCAAQILEIMQASAADDFVQAKKLAAEHVRGRFDVSLTVARYMREYARFSKRS